MIKERLKRVRDCMARAGLEQLIVTHDRCRMLCYILAVIDPEECEVTIYRDTGETIPQLRALLESGSTGVDGHLQSRFLLPLMQARPDMPLRVSSCVEEVRMIKTDDEIHRLRRASEVTDDVFADAFVG